MTDAEILRRFEKLEKRKRDFVDIVRDLAKESGRSFVEVQKLIIDNMLDGNV